MKRRRTARPIAATAIGAAVALLLLVGCKSSYIDTVVSNRTSKPVTLIEVDYPSASFGIDSLAAGASFPYQFKILDDGGMDITWTDASHHIRKSKGPTLHAGQHGRLTIAITPTGATWGAHISP